MSDDRSKKILEQATIIKIEGYQWECDECEKKITAQSPNRLLWMASEHVEQRGCDI